MFPVIFFSAILVSSALGDSVSRTPLNSLRTIFARKAPDFDPSALPSQCRSRCRFVTTALNDCQTSTNPACGCTIQVEDGFVDCLDCLIALSPSQSLIDLEQESVDQFVEACNAYGASLPSTVLSGVIPSATSGSLGATTIPTVTAPAAPSSTNVGITTITSLSPNPASTSIRPSPSASAIGSFGNFGVRRAGNIGKSTGVVIISAAAFALFL